MTSFFYQHEPTGIEYTRVAEIHNFLAKHGLSVNEWREAMSKTVETPLAWGELSSAREIYAMILDEYELVHTAPRDGRRL